MLGADGNLCARRLKMDRGAFYHQMYAVMEKLGRIFAEVRPYWARQAFCVNGLFPCAAG